jgi:hypothetical protein
LAAVLVAGPAAGVRLTVRAGAVLDARVVAKGDRIEVKGALRDDSGHGLGQSKLRVRVDRERIGPRPAACAPTVQNALEHTGDGGLFVTTDGAGEYCFTLGKEGGGSARLEFGGDRLHDRAEATVQLEVSKRSLVLWFEPEPRFLSLERETQSVRIGSKLEPDDGTLTEALQLRLVLEDRGTQKEIARAAVAAGEPAEMAVRSLDLGGPGPATITVEFAGSDTVAKSRRSSVVLRTAKVALSVPTPPRPSDPESGVEIDVAVGSARGAVTAGIVEALVGPDSVGAAPVADGAAHVVATFPTPASPAIPLTLRYWPSAQWWVAGDPVMVEVPISPPSPWRRLPWVIACLLAALGVARTWWRPPRSEKPERERASVPPGRPSLDVIEVGPQRSGWRGRVLDAHEATPIEGATVSIVVPTFKGDGLSARAVADSEGKFELQHVERAEGVRMEVRARWHSTLRKPLPPPGYVIVSLISRRRALLGRLVDWANRMGRPWSTPGDATPGHVARVARARHAADVGRWAESVERAAYGPEPPDESDEERITTAEPGWRGGDAN